MLNMERLFNDPRYFAEVFDGAITVKDYDELSAILKHIRRQSSTSTTPTKKTSSHVSAKHENKEGGLDANLIF